MLRAAYGSRILGVGMDHRGPISPHEVNDSPRRRVRKHRLDAVLLGALARSHTSVLGGAVASLDTIRDAGRAEQRTHLEELI